jgi:hypothetical protein
VDASTSRPRGLIASRSVGVSAPRPTVSTATVEYRRSQRKTQRSPIETSDEHSNTEGGNIPATKKPRFADAVMALPPATDVDGDDDDANSGADDNGDADADADPVTDTQPNAGANRATGRWTLKEDAQLTSAFKNTCKKNHCVDWVAIAALVPGRTKKSCWDRWHDVLGPNIDLASRRAGKWTADEDNELKNSVEMHCGKNFTAIATLVPGRTGNQCKERWDSALDPSIDRANERKGSWTAVEDSKQKKAVQTHNGKNWVAIAALVPGRTKKACWARWHDFLDPNIDLASRRTGK